jgi:hypothetical protein
MGFIFILILILLSLRACPLLLLSTSPVSLTSYPRPRLNLAISRRRSPFTASLTLILEPISELRPPFDLHRPTYLTLPKTPSHAGTPTQATNSHPTRPRRNSPCPTSPIRAGSGRARACPTCRCTLSCWRSGTRVRCVAFFFASFVCFDDG